MPAFVFDPDRNSLRAAQPIDKLYSLTSGNLYGIRCHRAGHSLCHSLDVRLPQAHAFRRTWPPSQYGCNRRSFSYSQDLGSTWIVDRFSIEISHTPVLNPSGGGNGFDRPTTSLQKLLNSVSVCITHRQQHTTAEDSSPSLKAIEVYAGSDRELTRRYCRAREARAESGSSLPRICFAPRSAPPARRSTAAASATRARTKAWRSPQNLVRMLGEHGAALGMTYGWESDPLTPGYSWGSLGRSAEGAGFVPRSGTQ